MASLLESSLSSNSIRRLKSRHSYMTKASHQQHKSKKKLLHDTAMKFCPAIWLAPAIIRAHEKHEYEKDRKHVQEVYIGYQEHRSRKNSFVGAGGRGSIVDLHTYPAPLEWPPVEDLSWDPWRYETLMKEDPWLLPPINEMT